MIALNNRLSLVTKALTKKLQNAKLQLGSLKAQLKQKQGQGQSVDPLGLSQNTVPQF